MNFKIIQNEIKNIYKNFNTINNDYFLWVWVNLKPIGQDSI